MAQGSQLVSPLPPAPWPLTSQRDNEIHDVLERYVQYYLVIRQILQILPNKQEAQPDIRSYTTKAGHNNLKVLCVDLIGPYTLEAKDGTSIDFMCLTVYFFPGDPSEYHSHHLQHTQHFIFTMFAGYTRLKINSIQCYHTNICIEIVQFEGKTFIKNPKNTTTVVVPFDATATWLWQMSQCPRGSLFGRG